MARIEVLSGDLVNQIAAGEVVERPASVVKELVENALDAGATRIDVEIAEGGIRWIAVSDDGEGLEPADARLAFERHATSKLRTTEDLARVETLGFRGEALPSIASVARVRMRTRRGDAALGVELEGEGAGIEQVRECSCPAGTRVEVAELFGRVPARRKFLKSPVTEATHIVRWLERISLARPDVRFSLERDGRSVLLLLPTADPRERAIAALPPNVGEHLVPVSGGGAGADLRGFASATHITRGTTADIHLLVNARPVRDRFLLHAVRSAYEDALPPGRHPAAVLYLSVDPGEVDVNVHPAKAEVRFRDPGAIRSLIRESLIAALGLRARSAGAYREAQRGFRIGEPRPPAELGLLGRGPGLGQLDPPSDPAAYPPAGLADQRPAAPLAAHRYLGQVLGTYLVLEGPDELVLLDQHAAHERVLFERLRQTWLDGKLERQALLLPVRSELPRSLADALEAYSDQLARAGFEIEVGGGALAGGTEVVLRTVPALVGGAAHADWPRLLEETAAGLREPESSSARDGIDGAVHGILATAACHSAVRKGDRLVPEEVKALLESLDETVWFPNCPHGRPVLVTLAVPELERRFARR